MKIFGSYLSKLQKNPVRKIYYKTIGSLSFGQRMRFSALNSLLDLNKDEIILDAGSGEGIYSLQFAINNDCAVIGVDLSKENAEKAKKRAKDLRVNNVQFNLGDLCNLPLSNNIFDKAICIDVLEHISNDNRAIRELNRVLKEKGELILTTPHEQVETRRFLYFGRAAEDHVRDGYNPNLLVKKLEYNNFKVLSIRYYARYFEEISWEIGKIIRQKYPRLWAVVFPILLVVSKIDYILPKQFIGNGIAIKAVKTTEHEKKDKTKLLFFA